MQNFHLIFRYEKILKKNGIKNEDDLKNEDGLKNEDDSVVIFQKMVDVQRLSAICMEGT